MMMMTANHGVFLQHMQIENEFGNSKYPNYPTDKQHLEALRDTLLASGIEALLFTSDPPSIGRNYGALPGGTGSASALRRLQFRGSLIRWGSH